MKISCEEKEVQEIFEDFLFKIIVIIAILVALFILEGIFGLLSVFFSQFSKCFCPD